MSQNKNVYKEIHLLSLSCLWGNQTLSSDMVTHRRCWPVKGNPDSPMRLDSWYSGCYLSIDCMSNFHFLQTSTTGGARVQGEVVRRPNIYRTDLCDPVKSISRINDALLVRLRNVCCVTIVTLVLIVMRNGSWSLRQVLTTWENSCQRRQSIYSCDKDKVWAQQALANDVHRLMIAPWNRR